MEELTRKQKPKPKESEIEKAVGLHAKKLGWLFWKFTSPTQRGVPDRILVHDGPLIVFIEFKRPGGKLTPLQTKKIEKLRSRGVDVYVIDNVKDGNALLDQITPL
tara:strand:+ start:1507 stop:1821 length:315 start_codon:yes stop_codon:yes gene_type:complete